jgi:hypothetical protein
MPDNEILSTIWNNCSHNKMHSEMDWEVFLQELYGLGIGMEETMQYLYLQRPSFMEFEQWINENSRPLLVESSADTALVLSAEDLLFWETNGYVVIKNAIAKEDCIATQKAIADFIGINLADSDTWYTNYAAIEGLMVLFTKHASLEKNRASVKIRTAYEQLYGSTALYKTIDKVSFNPPETEVYKFQGSPLHWDVDLSKPIADKFQGLLYLTDVQEHGGAFQCVPGFHKKMAAWLPALPKEQDPHSVAQQTFNPIPIAGNAGDFIIWHPALPHSATANKSTMPRMVQYLTYLPK